MRRHADFSREIGEGMAGEAVSRAGVWVDINALFLDRLVGAEGNPIYGPSNCSLHAKSLECEPIHWWENGWVILVGWRIFSPLRFGL
jgi:hypothetical protein